MKKDVDFLDNQSFPGEKIKDSPPGIDDRNRLPESILKPAGWFSRLKVDKLAFYIRFLDEIFANSKVCFFLFFSRIPTHLPMLGEDPSRFRSSAPFLVAR